MLPLSSYTYPSHAWNTTSWIDHCMTTKAGHECINEIEILYNFVTSDHKPMRISVNYENIHEKININLKNSYNIQWSSANKDSLHAYKLEIRTELKKIKLPMNLLYCKDINCESTNCRTDIDYLCKSIINSLSNAAKKVFEQRVKTPECSYAVTGWNEYVAEAHTNARKAYKYWHDAGKPRGGSIAETMRKSRSIFKYALRFCKRNNNINRNDFGKEIKKIQNCTKSLSASINGITGDDNITELWKNHYKNIFSSVLSDNMNATYRNSLSDDDKFSFTCAEVTKTVDSFTAGKAADHSGISAAHLKNSDDTILVFLTLLLNASLRHGYIPNILMDSVITPILKDKNGNISDTSNYIPITVASTISKVLEKLLLNIINKHVNTKSNQFGFKSRHGTEICNFVLKETIRHYNNLSSSDFTCFLDASTAFDVHF